ncbi:hypothetical protein CTheo_7226 [Ceratobasidium theobromae]|uniref:Jacalin-type lectin domain-containing protein n=1 Tax=Ceratobasidium theobromae TaxID=1582974 RepID=A0A5N5QCD6_9AGAM|nr:hypothetical protein CTheo_7226 [Ceratobasidium theobromae]
MLPTSLFLIAVSTLCFAIPNPNRPSNATRVEEGMNWKKSELYGGPHGKEFDDSSLIPSNANLASLTLRGDKRLDGITFNLTSGETFTHGGSGGDPHPITLDKGEYITCIKLCKGRKSKKTRIFYALATTSTGRTIQAGRATDDCTVVSTPEGFTVVGGYGRSGDEIDQLGFIYGPQATTPVVTSTSSSIVMEQSPSPTVVTPLSSPTVVAPASSPTIATPSSSPVVTPTPNL